MAKTDLTIPSLGNKFVDYRENIPGDSFNWSWIRPLTQVNYLAIHNHAATPDIQTPEQIANSHMSNNGWGGIGYHFLISQDGTVYYVGDIQTARANVANLNEQVIGICLIGDFTQGHVPTTEQLDSTHKLCDFFINNYPDLTNVNSWDKVRGHKELPGQTTTCPGDDFASWRIQIVEGVDTSGEFSEDQKKLMESADKIAQQENQINGLQTSLASVNQQLISFQEALQQREQQINQLKIALQSREQQVTPVASLPAKQKDNTLTVVGALINLYQFLFPSRKVDAF